MFAIKLVVLVQLKDHPLLQTDAGLDTSAYAALAERVAHGDLTLGPGVYFVSPLYVYFCALILALGGSFVTVRVIQIVLGTVAVYCIYVAARETFGVRAARWAAALAALTGVFTFYEALLIQAALDPFLVAASLASLALATTRNRPVMWLLAGVFVGLATLNRPNVLPAALAACAAAAATAVAPKLWRRNGGLIVLGLMVALAPVAIRNGIVAGDWSPMPSQGGLNFYIGNNAGADGTYRPVPGIRATIDGQAIDTREVASRALGHPVTDREASSYFFGQGLAWIRSAPQRAAALFVHKFVLLLNRAHVFLNYSYPFFAYDARTLLMALPVGAWLLMPLGVAGLFLRSVRSASAPPDLRPPTPHLRPPSSTLLAFSAVYAVTTAAFFVSDRYRLPLLVPMAIAAGGAIDSIVGRVFRPGGTRAAIAGFKDPAYTRFASAYVGFAVLVALFVFVNWPVHVDDGRAEERARMAERLIQRGDYADADRWAALAEQHYPRPAVLRVRIGRQLLQAREPGLALLEFERAASLEPNESEVQFSLGEALIEAGRAEDAIDHLRRAIALNPRVAAPHQQLGLALGMQNRLREAATELAEAIRLDPSEATSHLNLAVVYAQRGEFARARDEAQEALRLRPGYSQAQQLLAALPATRH